MVRLHAVIDLPADRHANAARFWAAVTGWPIGAARPGRPELRSLEPPEGTAYLHLQEIGGSPRVHLDVETDDPASFVTESIALGALPVADHDRWQTLRSPGGLPFCVVPAQPHRPAAAGPARRPLGRLAGRRVRRQVAR
ncbi:VOC family protein [Nocardioides sp. YIM 152315]|uniref:VOC family protein n=1 Tax=Nocardioides sp. YIM 152315 TaxID=3031760 RepID=UPI0023D99508|nr:VOC family protein [Nocardioides sp. YIM 152315]MDF1602186.1 VOC family protein [Nocardioides sp. YIM 152315]